MAANANWYGRMRSTQATQTTNSTAMAASLLPSTGAASPGIPVTGESLTSRTMAVSSKAPTAARGSVTPM